MKLDWLQRIVQPKPAVTELARVRPGKRHVGGVVKSGPDLLHSPQKNIPCVAFFYRAYYTVQGRTGAAERNIKACEVHAPVFFLEMEGGTLRVVSKKVEPFTADDHRKIASSGMQRLRIEEQSVKPGGHITIVGRVFEDTEGLSIRPKEIRLVEAAAKKAVPRARPKGKKKARRKAR